MKEDVTCLIRNPIKKQMFSSAAIKFFVGDVTKPESLAKLAGNFDCVYHVAGQLIGKNEKDFYDINANGVQNLYEVLNRAIHKPSKIVHVSSIAALGPSKKLEYKTEEDFPEPVSIYGKSKLAGESIARSYMNKLPITILRPSTVYGPGDRNLLILCKMVQRGLVFTPPKQPKHYSMLHVRSFVDVMIQSAKTEMTTGEIINVADESCSWCQLTTFIAEALNTKPKHLSVGSFPFYAMAMLQSLKRFLPGSRLDILTFQKLPELFAQYWLVDTLKLSKRINSVGNVSLADGILETIKWYQQNEWL